MKRRLSFLVLILIIAVSVASAQQMADPEFNTSVENPAYSKSGPRVMFDEAHHNFHTMDGRYQPFANLLLNDGYRVIRNRVPFTKKSLEDFKVLVIANALGAEEMDDTGADNPAFTEAETEAVHDWVRSGGSLLLIADHAPFGGAAESLGKRFGVEMSKGFTLDEANSAEGNPSVIIYSRENHLLLEHPITSGRGGAEKINKVMSFTGQSLVGPKGSYPILKLADTAKDTPDRSGTTFTPAAGRAQALAFKFGKGRVVVQGEAAMLSAQIAGANKFKMGMNVPGTDNKQYALNLMHWLSGMLKEN
ncbi:MAG TPA: DUF4350 domain-containing protein [Pyrinomonadaceae bacterium]|nr:DUF4350 domain-containing protein [Pyrinomonadaceae bacterium]